MDTPVTVNENEDEALSATTECAVPPATPLPDVAAGSRGAAGEQDIPSHLAVEGPRLALPGSEEDSEESVAAATVEQVDALSNQAPGQPLIDSVTEAEYPTAEMPDGVAPGQQPGCDGSPPSMPEAVPGDAVAPGTELLGTPAVQSEPSAEPPLHVAPTHAVEAVGEEASVVPPSGDEPTPPDPFVDADVVAQEIETQLDALELAYVIEKVRTYRHFWDSVRALNERMRATPVLDPDDVADLRRRINTICQQVRQEQRQARERSAAWRAEMLGILGLATDGIADATNPSELHEIREDLTHLRARITDATVDAARSARQEVWEAWQTANRTSWEKLNEFWRENESSLGAVLDQAEERLESGDTRGAKELVKSFQSRIGTAECSRAAAGRLRARSRALWARASDAGRERHDKYVQHLERQVPMWRSAQMRVQRRQADLRQQIGELERLASAPGTAVATALLRGQLEERRRQLADAQAQERDLNEKLARAESALQRTGGNSLDVEP